MLARACEIAPKLYSFFLETGKKRKRDRTQIKLLRDHVPVGGTSDQLAMYSIFFFFAFYRLLLDTFVHFGGNYSIQWKKIMLKTVRT